LKKVIVSVTNDLSSDQRVHRHCATLVALGFDVLLVGRQYKNSLLLPQRSYSCKRMKLWFSKGPFFYAEYNFRLFFFLLFQRFDLLLSNDLDTLLPNYLVASLRSKKLVYDSHEFYTGVPELVSRPRVQRIWLSIEKYIFPKLKYVMTVNDSIASIYKELYGISLAVVRNVPAKRPLPSVTRAQMGLPLQKKIILMQGAGINIDRGAEEIIEAMRLLSPNDYVFLIVGSGDVLPQLKKMVQDYKINEQVIFVDKVPMDVLMCYTVLADVGVTMDKDTNVNYRYSLPNKLFDYIQCGLPVLATNLLEVQKVITQHKVGAIVDDLSPKALAHSLGSFLNDDEALMACKRNAKIAAEELCWEKEKMKFEQIIRNATKV